MRTRPSSNLPGESSPNPTSSNPKHCNRRRSKQPFILEESPVDTLADQRTMTELLRAPIKGYAEAIVVPPILAEQFEHKHSLINMMTSDQFFGLEKDNPHDHIWAARHWLKKEPSILTWEDLAWDRYKDLIYACPHHGFTELHQLDSFYNALNPADQDSLNSAASGNLLERRSQDVLTIIENKFKVRNSQNKLIVSQVKSSDANSSSSSEIAKLTHAVNQQTSAMTTAMTAILKQFQATPPPASMKPDNIQGYVSAAAVNYNQGNSGYRPPVVPLSELEKIKKMNEINMKAMQTQINNVKNELRNEMKTSIQASMSNQTNELKNMMTSFFQMNTASTLGLEPLPSNTIANPKGELKAITTRSGLVLDGPSVPMPPLFINPEEDERVKETLTNLELSEFTIKVLPPLVQKPKPPSQRNYVVHQRDPLHPNIPYPSWMHKQKQQEKDQVYIHKFWKMFKQLHINITLADALIIIPKETLFLILPKISSQNNINPLSGSTTSSSPDHLLEEFADELPLITFLPGNDDLPFDIESDLREIEYLLNHDPIKEMDSILEDSINESNLANPNVNLFDTILEMFTDEHALDYSSPPLYADYDDNLNELDFDNDDAYNDPFDSKGEKIKKSKLLIDELDVPRSSDFFPSPKYDSFLFEDFSEVDALPSTNNEDKVFNPGILIQEILSESNVQATPVKNIKKIAISHASLILEDFDPPLYELSFHKEVPRSETLLSFSPENEEKVFKTRISLLKEFILLFSWNYLIRAPKLSKSLKFLKARWRFFLALLERTSASWMFRVSISIPYEQINSGVGSS
uniref:Reverse transcriptase domain-containing protein n=1 Tax=Tanacetum cinerariifolium TaxID=118510 RepID=A0A6L2NJL1_TANCI|nr:hypothetical protein [Tanacetum cinerariifolium]